MSHFSRLYKYSDRVREGYRIKGSFADLKFPPFRRITSWPRFLAVKLDSVGWQWSAAANGGVATTTTTTLTLNYVA